MIVLLKKQSGNTNLILNNGCVKDTSMYGVITQVFLKQSLNMKYTKIFFFSRRTKKDKDVRISNTTYQWKAKYPYKYSGILANTTGYPREFGFFSFFFKEWSPKCLNNKKFESDRPESEIQINPSNKWK